MNLTFAEESSPHFDGQLWKTFDETGKRRKEAVIAAPTGCGRIQNVGGGALDAPCGGWRGTNKRQPDIEQTNWSLSGS